MAGPRLGLRARSVDCAPFAGARRQALIDGRESFRGRRCRTGNVKPPAPGNGLPRMWSPWDRGRTYQVATLLPLLPLATTPAPAPPGQRRTGTVRPVA